jgi:hypothetical protein
MESFISGVLWWIAVCLASWVFWTPVLLYQRAKEKRRGK